MKIICFGIIGTGAMASTMMEAFSNVAHVAVLAVHSKNSKRAHCFAQLHNIPEFYSNLDEMLNNDKIDAIYIANSTEKQMKYYRM